MFGGTIIFGNTHICTIHLCILCRDVLCTNASRAIRGLFLAVSSFGGHITQSITVTYPMFRYFSLSIFLPKLGMQQSAQVWYLMNLDASWKLLDWSLEIQLSCCHHGPRKVEDSRNIGNTLKKGLFCWSFVFCSSCCLSIIGSEMMRDGEKTGASSTRQPAEKIPEVDLSTFWRMGSASHKARLVPFDL